MSDTANKTTTATSTPQSSGGILSQALSDQPISRVIDVPAKQPELSIKDLSEIAKKDAEITEKLIQEAKQKLEEIKSQNNPINLQK